MQSMIKPKLDQTHREVDRGDWTTSRLLSTSISLHVAVSFVYQSKGCWIGVNWNQFLLSDTINGVAQTGQRGAYCRLLVTDPAAQTCLEFAIWNLACDNNKPTSFSVYTWLHPKLSPPGPSTHPQGRVADGCVTSGCPQSSHPRSSRNKRKRGLVEHAAVHFRMLIPRKTLIISIIYNTTLMTDF